MLIHHALDGDETVHGRGQAGDPAGAVIVARPAAIDVLPALDAVAHQHRLERGGRILGRVAFVGVGGLHRAVERPAQVLAGALHQGGEASGLLGQGLQHHLGEVDTSGHGPPPLGSGHHGLVAAHDGPVSGLGQRDADLGEPGGDCLIGKERRLAQAEGRQPEGLRQELLRRAGADAHGDRGLEGTQLPGEPQHHQGQLVGNVGALCVHAAQGHVLRLIALPQLQPEAGQSFAGLGGSAAARGQIGLAERPQVLIHSSRRDGDGG